MEEKLLRGLRWKMFYVVPCDYFDFFLCYFQFVLPENVLQEVIDILDFCLESYFSLYIYFKKPN